MSSSAPNFVLASFLLLLLRRVCAATLKKTHACQESVTRHLKYSSGRDALLVDSGRDRRARLTLTHWGIDDRQGRRPSPSGRRFKQELLWCRATQSTFQNKSVKRSTRLNLEGFNTCKNLSHRDLSPLLEISKFQWEQLESKGWWVNMGHRTPADPTLRQSVVLQWNKSYFLSLRCCLKHEGISWVKMALSTKYGNKIPVVLTPKYSNPTKD